MTKIDLQRATRRKNTAAHVELNQKSNEPAKSPFKNILAKISIPTFDTLERKHSSMSNDVFYEVCCIQNLLIF